MSFLSISIVVYRPELLLLNDVVSSVVTSVRAAPSAAEDTKLFIVNNCPQSPLSEDVLEEFKIKCSSYVELIYLESGVNSGYGAGNNLAIKSVDSAYHLVLNPDALIDECFIRKSLEYMKENDSVGLLVPRVIGFDGELHYLCKRNSTLFDMFLRGVAPRFIKKLFAKRMAWFEMRDKDYTSKISPVPFPTGCCMFFRGDLLRSIGGFDESFFMYLEDADIGRRVNQVSTSVYNPDLLVRHKWERGTHNNFRLKLVTIRSAFVYFRKWGGLI